MPRFHLGEVWTRKPSVNVIINQTQSSSITMIIGQQVKMVVEHAMCFTFRHMPPAIQKATERGVV